MMESHLGGVGLVNPVLRGENVLRLVDTLLIMAHVSRRSNFTANSWSEKKARVSSDGRGHSLGSAEEEQTEIMEQ